LNQLASFQSNKIELDCEYEPNPQLYDLIPNFESILTSVSLHSLDTIPVPTLILVPIDYEIESPVVDSHIPLMDHECELKFFDLDPSLEPNSTPEPKFDFFESVLVPESIILKPKSITSACHILLLNQGIDNYDSEMIF